jgi:hypothetical protein
MESKHFSIWFFSFFIILIGVLILMYINTSLVDGESGALSVFWSAFILLFLIFGIIVISLYMKWVGKKSRKGL